MPSPTPIIFSPKGRLLLEQYSQRVAELWRSLPSVNAIHRQLKSEGVVVCLRTLQVWCQEQVEFGYLPRRPRHDRRGRPRRRIPKSLGFLDRFQRGDDAYEILCSLSPFSPFPANEEQLKHALGPDGLDLVTKPGGEPDYHQSALEFGRARVESFGDLDYFLLARWSTELRDIRPGNRMESNALHRRALELAVKIRTEMLAAVQGRTLPT